MYKNARANGFAGFPHVPDREIKWIIDLCILEFVFIKKKLI